MVKKVVIQHNYQARILKVSWDAPQYIPYSYKLLLNCDLLCNNTLVQYRKTQYNLKSTTVYTTIYGILESSKCKLNLLAEYNPASIDPGLDKPFVIALPVKSKYIVYISTAFYLPEIMHNSAFPDNDRLPNAVCGCKYMKVHG